MNSEEATNKDDGKECIFVSERERERLHVERYPRSSGPIFLRPGQEAVILFGFFTRPYLGTDIGFKIRYLQVGYIYIYIFLTRYNSCNRI